jgi:ribosomal protein L16 Arg81 hydroxylase
MTARNRAEIEDLFGDLSLRGFVEGYFQKLPIAMPGKAGGLARSANRQTAERIVRDENADLLIVRQGVQRPAEPGLTLERARELLDEGFTLVVRHAERHDPALAAGAAEFRRALAEEVNVHLYWTPTNQHGFGWHYDAEDVFVVQAVGRKSYSVRKNTVNPWPTRETLPRDMHYEQEIMPLFRCSLAPGDWLYVPAGFWHMGEADEESITLAVGVMSPTRLDLLGFFRRRLAASLAWRERLPVARAGAVLSEEQLQARLREVLGEVVEEMGRMTADNQTAADLLAYLRGSDEPGP